MKAETRYVLDETEYSCIEVLAKIDCIHISCNQCELHQNDGSMCIKGMARDIVSARTHVPYTYTEIAKGESHVTDSRNELYG